MLTQNIIEDYMVSEKELLRDEALGLIMGTKPTLLEIKPRSEKILHKIVGYVNTFVGEIE